MKYFLPIISTALLSFNFAFAADLNKCRTLLSSVLKQPPGYYLAIPESDGPATRLNISSDPLPVLNLANGWSGQQPQGLGQIYFDWATMFKYAPLASFKATGQMGRPISGIKQKFYNEVISCGVLPDGTFSIKVDARTTNTDFSSWPIFEELNSSSQVIKISAISKDVILVQGEVDYVEYGKPQHFENSMKAKLVKVEKQKFFY